MLIVRAVSDLMFSRRIREVAESLGLEHVVAKSADTLELVLKAHAPESLIVIVDLALISVNEFLARALSVVPASQLYTFYSHVAVTQAQEAKSLGAINVMPRSQFFEMLPEMLSTWKK